MKSTYNPLLTLAFLICTLPLFATQVVFSGHIKNAVSDEVRISLLVNELTLERSVFVCRLNEENKFIISIEVPQTQISHFIYEGKLIELFVDTTMPKIDFEIDRNNWEQSLLFKGKSSANNQFFKTFRTHYVPQAEQSTKYELGYLSSTFNTKYAELAQSYEMHSYFNYLKDRFNEQQRFLNNSPRISRNMRDFARNEINWNYETHKLSYFLLNKKFIDTKKLRDYWLQFQLLQTVDLSNEKGLAFPSYQNMLTAFIHYLHLESLQGKENGLDLDFYRFIERNLAGKARYFMQAKLMLNAYNSGNSELAHRKFKGYVRFNTFPFYTQTLKYIFGNNLTHVTKTQVPDFTFMNTQGTQKRLSDYRNQVVYISFWASWCSPCIKGFQETKASRTELNNQGVKFINVNIDEQESAWRKTLARVKTPGEHVYALDVKDFFQKMNFRTLPFYVLVDKNGQLNYLSTDDMNTSKEDFITLLNE